MNDYPTTPTDQQFEIRKRRATKIYTADLVSTLAKRFDIQAKKELRHFLLSAAIVYLEQKDDRISVPKSAALRGELLEIEKCAADLKAAISSLGAEAAELFWYPYRHEIGDLFFTDKLVSPYGHNLIRRKHESGATSFEYLKAPQIIEAAEVAGNLAAHAAMRLKKDKGGRPPDDPLQMWITNVQGFWIKALKRPFTYDAIRGEGLTKAFEFCWAIMQPLDARITKKNVGTAMRKAINSSNRYKRRATGAVVAET